MATFFYYPSLCFHSCGFQCLLLLILLLPNLLQWALAFFLSIFLCICNPCFGRPSLIAAMIIRYPPTLYLHPTLHIRRFPDPRHLTPHTPCPHCLTHYLSVESHLPSRGPKIKGRCWRNPVLFEKDPALAAAIWEGHKGHHPQ